MAISNEIEDHPSVGSILHFASAVRQTTCVSLSVRAACPREPGPRQHRVKGVARCSMEIETGIADHNRDKRQRVQVAGDAES
jgi:hypothetical protein